MHSFGSQARGILIDVIEDRHEKRSTMLATQAPVKGWQGVTGENWRRSTDTDCLQAMSCKEEENEVKTAADAVLARIVHHALCVELLGESIRKRKTKSGGA